MYAKADENYYKEIGTTEEEYKNWGAKDKVAAFETFGKKMAVDKIKGEIEERKSMATARKAATDDKAAVATDFTGFQQAYANNALMPESERIASSAALYPRAAEHAQFDNFGKTIQSARGKPISAIDQQNADTEAAKAKNNADAGLLGQARLELDKEIFATGKKAPAESEGVQAKNAAQARADNARAEGYEQANLRDAPAEPSDPSIAGDVTDLAEYESMDKRGRTHTMWGANIKDKIATLKAGVQEKRDVLKAKARKAVGLGGGNKSGKGTLSFDKDGNLK